MALQTRFALAYPGSVLTLEDVENLLLVGYEGRGFEMKGPGSSEDKAFLVKVARAGLSMGNLRDGGHVVIGINDTKPQEMQPGLDDEQLASWLAYDDVADRLAAYADPPLRFDLAQFTLSSGARVVLLEIHEFDDIPHLCARDYPDDLRKGALYVRSRKKPETAEVASSVEMREILDLAAEKRLRAYIETAERAGVRIVAGEEIAVEKSVEGDREQFESQLREAWNE
jgi:hypothetical protein